MSDSFIYVRPATESNRVKVKTHKIGEVELPAYVQTDENGDLISSTNPLPVDTQNIRSAFGELLVSQLSPIFQNSFEYSVDNTDLTTNTVVNGGTVTQSQAMAVVNSSTTTASTAELRSLAHGRYRAGQGSVIRFTGLFTTPAAATEQFIGIMDEIGSSVAYKNGFSVGYNGTTFGFHRFVNDALVTVTQANWDDPMDGSGASGMTLDQTKLNIFYIQFQYLGAGAITLWIENDSTGMMVKAHTILYANNNITPSLFNPNLHFHMFVDNKATTENLTVKSGSYGFFIEGQSDFTQTHQPQNSSGLKQKTAVTTEVAIFTIRNKALYNAKNNFIEIVLENISGSIEASSANNLGAIRLVKNATLGGTPSYSDINTTNSVVDIDTAGTTLSAGVTIINASLAGKNDKFSENIMPYHLILRNGETLTVAGVSANSATIQASILWKELF